MRSQPLLFFLLVSLLAVPGVLAQPESEEEMPAEFASPVQVEEATEILMPQRVPLFGTVEPFRRSNVATEVEGIVETFPYVEGDTIEAGAVAVCLRNGTFQIQRNAALASLRSASAELERLENGYRPWEIDAAEAHMQELSALAEEAQRDLARNRQLLSEGAATEEDLEEAETTLAAARSRVSQASANLSLLEEGYRAEEIARARADAELRSAELARIDDQIEKTRVRAPFSGAISATLTELGEWVGEGDPVLELIQLDPVLIHVDVPERYLSGLRPGRPAVVTFDALPDSRVEGKVTRLVPDANVSARTFPAKIEIPNPKGEIRSGMLARVDLEVGEPRRVLTVPKDAIVLSARGNSVFTVENGRANLVPVTIGDSYNHHIEVKADIKPGTPVVTRGNERLRPGQKVMVQVGESADTQDGNRPSG
jgi:multidrug efflux pump subunit AcrA (membrane-fusion protein)